MRLKRILSLLVAIAFLSSPLAQHAVAHTTERIDPVFLQEVHHSSAWIHIVIELRDLPGVEFQHQQNALPFSTFSASDYQHHLLQKQDHFLAWVSKNRLSLIPRHHLTLTLNAITAEIKGHDIEALSLCPLIYKIHDARHNFEPIRYLGSQSTRTDLVWEGLEDAGLPPLSGKNLIIGVMDTGLDATHPEFAQEGKVIGGWNIAEDNDDISDDGSHGTVVAGVAAGSGGEYEKNGRGMAYDAQIMVYRIFSKKSSVPADLIKAIEMAAEDGCDILNLSFGGHSDQSSIANTVYHRTLRNADQAGTFVVAGSGNSGARRKEVPWPILSPSIIDTVFSVAGSDDRSETPFLTLHTSETTTRTFQAIQTPHTPKLHNALLQNGIVDAGYGLFSELQPLDLSGKVALIQRGPGRHSLSFRDKLENAYQAGAVGVIFYNNYPHQNFPYHILRHGEKASDVQHLPPSISLSMEDGEYLKKSLQGEIKINIEYLQYSTIANFSSMGLSGDAAFKPEITAPATHIVSTVPNGRYGNSSGTSFSTPMISGMAALIKEAHPTWDHQQIKSALMNTADLMINPYNHLPITFTLQGAGTARLDKALQTPAFLEPRALVLSETPDEVSQTFTVTNASDQTQTFQLSAHFFHLQHETLPLSVTFDQSQIRLEQGQEASFTAHFKLDRSAFLQNRYEGIIQVGSDLHIPIICYRDPAQQVEDSISNIRLSHEPLDFTQQDADTSPPVQISFSLNAGELITRVTQSYTVYSSHNYGTVYVDIIDDTGEAWGRIKTFNHIMVGEYTFLWDGTNQYGEQFLPEGDFTLSLTINMREHRSQQWTTKTYGPFLKDFQVKASDMPPFIIANLSTLKMYQGDEPIPLGIRLHKLPPYFTPEEEISSIEFYLHYDPHRQLAFKQYRLQGFLTTENLDEITIEDFEEGILKVTLTFNDLYVSIMNESVFLVLEFSMHSRGNLSFYTRSFQVHTTPQNTYRVKAYGVQSRTTSRPFLLSDLNGDRRVDHEDLEIFIQSYGAKAGDEHFNEMCDFNQDRRIDIYDLMILTQEMGREI